MAAARPVAPTQPHLARLRVERQHRLIEELRLAAGRHATAEIAALIASVASVGPDISATARSALTRLLHALQPPDPPSQ